MSRFFDWFQPDQKQREEIEELVQSILLKKLAEKTLLLLDRKKALQQFQAIQALNQDDPETSKFIVAAFTALEISYYDLIEEILHGLLSIDELNDLYQFLETE